MLLLLLLLLLWYCNTIVFEELDRIVGGFVFCFVLRGEKAKIQIRPLFGNRVLESERNKNVTVSLFTPRASSHTLTHHFPFRDLIIERSLNQPIRSLSLPQIREPIPDPRLT
jgi:hypothetical protein